MNRREMLLSCVATALGTNLIPVKPNPKKDVCQAEYAVTGQHFRVVCDPKDGSPCMEYTSVGYLRLTHTGDFPKHLLEEKKMFPRGHPIMKGCVRVQSEYRLRPLREVTKDGIKYVVQHLDWGFVDRQMPVSCTGVKS